MKNQVTRLLCLVAMLEPTPSVSQSLVTIAGGGADDGRSATAAALRRPQGVAVDARGHIFIADHDDHRIRHVDPETGIISTVAGNGVKGITGDDGAASAASLNYPSGIAVDATGNLYIADYVNHRIRRVDVSSGYISTAAGTGARGFSGDGGRATNAQLSGPTGVALDAAGNLFIADAGNNRVRRVDGRTGSIASVAGSGVGGFGGDGGPATAGQLDSPGDVSVDAAGNLVISDCGNHRIRRVDWRTGVIMTVVGSGNTDFSGDGGPAVAAGCSTAGLTVDANGNIFFADTANSRIRRVDGSTGIITSVAGTSVGGFSGDDGPSTEARLNYPQDVAVDASGNLLVVDTFNRRVRRVDARTGVIATLAGSALGPFTGDGALATAAGLNSPSGVAADSLGGIVRSRQ